MAEAMEGRILLATEYINTGLTAANPGTFSTTETVDDRELFFGDGSYNGTDVYMLYVAPGGSINVFLSYSQPNAPFFVRINGGTPPNFTSADGLGFPGSEELTISATDTSQRVSDERGVYYEVLVQPVIGFFAGPQGEISYDIEISTGGGNSEPLDIELETVVYEEAIRSVGFTYRATDTIKRFKASVYRSADESLDAGDGAPILTKEFTVPPSGQGTGIFDLPDLPIGLFNEEYPFAIVEVDSADDYAETDERNNMQAVRIWEPFEGDLILHSFTHHNNGEVLALRYEVKPLDGSTSVPPFILSFYASENETYEPGQDGDRVYSAEISPEAFAIDEALVGLYGDIDEYKRALEPGEHTLLIRPALAGNLGVILEDPEVEAIIAVIDPADEIDETDSINPYNEDNSRIFRGYYQGDAGRRGVIRTGPKASGEVTIINRELFSVSTLLPPVVSTDPPQPPTSWDYEAIFNNPSGVLIKTSDFSDRVLITDEARLINYPLIIDTGDSDDILSSAGGDDILVGGLGDDVYVFGKHALGMDQIIDSEGEGSDRNRLDFTNHSQGIVIDLSDSGRQRLNSQLSLQFPDLAITTVIGSNYSDVIEGNLRTNFLLGGSGIDFLYAAGSQKGVGDVIVGGNDNDYLYGSNADDLMLGDDISFSVDNVPSVDSKLDALQNLLRYKIISGKWEPSGQGNDLIFGRDGLDLIFGGFGDDRIYGGAGGGILFGDFFSFGLSVDARINLLQLKRAIQKGSLLGIIKSFIKISPVFGRAGDGNDLIQGGTGVDFIVGGDGRNRMYGFGGSDALFGGKDHDLVNGGETTNYLIGGDGPDTFIFFKPVIDMTDDEYEIFVEELSDYDPKEDKDES